MTRPHFGAPAALVDFFDEHLRGIDPDRPAPRVTWWLDRVDADQSWQQSDHWPGIAAPRQSWHLARAANSDALVLTTGPAREGEAKFRVDYDVGAGEYFAFWVDSQHGRGVSFTSDALESGQALVGFAVVRLAPSARPHRPVAQRPAVDELR